MACSKLILAISAAGVLVLTCAAGAAQDNQSRGAVVQIRIDVGGKVMMATLEDNPTVTDFVSLLPLTMTLEDHAAFEKISYLPRKLSTKGAPEGVTPSAGDVGYYAPWRNLALFHKNFPYSTGLVRLGRIDDAIDVLRVPGTVEARIELVD
ncbi:cyclophilin-like fold protein [Flaviflagellibacter deserti]|uniref:Cyclophilin-like fold protein n=1 Tax=Flaviflagellibacter deserti TaxID=2267266 RepID=A0ABV9Z1U7_9HYPH